MKASTICSVIVTMAVAASAVPTANNEVEARTDKTLGGASNTCSSTQVVSCCNNSNKQNSAGLISVISGPILGNGCTGIGANALTTLSNKPASSVCGNQNSVKCCQGNKNTGLLVVDLQCTTVL